MKDPLKLPSNKKGSRCSRSVSRHSRAGSNSRASKVRSSQPAIRIEQQIDILDQIKIKAKGDPQNKSSEIKKQMYESKVFSEG